MAITLVVGLVMAGVTLPLASAGALRHYWWVLLCIPVILVALYPPAATFGLNLALRIIRRPPLDTPPSLGGMARAAGWTALGWIFYGLHAWLLVGAIAGKSLHVLLLSAGGYALAWAVGFLLIPFPGGIGPREVVLIAVLSPVMPRGPALAVALASRVVLTVGDLAWAALAMLIGRRATHGTAGAGGADGTSEASESGRTMASVGGTAPSGPLAPGPKAQDRKAPAPAGRPGSAESPGRGPSSDPDRAAEPPNATGPAPPAR
jgi:hypothetical protein